MTTNSLHDVIDALRKAETFLVTSHTGPDGDSVGSVLSMKCLLQALGKREITCALQDPVPRVYDWMPGTIEIVDADNVEPAYDLVVVLDVAQRKRIGRVGEALKDDQKFVIVDHHPEEAPFGIVNFVDRTYASCAEIVFDLFDAAGVEPSLDAATAIYVGLVTDTGSFRFNNTDARAHRHAARLLELGVNAPAIVTRVYDSMSMQKLELLRRVLARIERSGCERYAWSHLLARDLEQADASDEDTDGLVNYVRDLEGIQVAALFRELSPGKVKVSLRARRPVDAGAMVKPLGGGGHAGAAGLILQTPMDEAIEKVTARMAEALGPVPELSAKRSE